MSKRKGAKTKHISLYIEEEEYRQLKENIAATTCRSFSEYGRKLLLGMPVVVTYRNRSFDDLTEAFVQFKRDAENILATGTFTETEKFYLFETFKSIKETLIQIDNYARENKNIHKHS
jgi:hypothetical protein